MIHTQQEISQAEDMVVPLDRRAVVAEMQDGKAFFRVIHQASMHALDMKNVLAMSDMVSGRDAKQAHDQMPTSIELESNRDAQSEKVRMWMNALVNNPFEGD